MGIVHWDGLEILKIVILVVAFLIAMGWVAVGVIVAWAKKRFTRTPPVQDVPLTPPGLGWGTFIKHLGPTPVQRDKE